MNKGDFGYIALVGGSVRYSGAMKLANIASCAMRSGAGVVKLAVPQSIATAVAPYLLESTLFPLAEKDGQIDFNPKQLDDLTHNVNTVAFGMGAGVCAGVTESLLYLLHNYTKTLIIDADGLNCLAQVGSEVLLKCTPRVIITPHAKEFARLTRRSVDDIKSNGATIAQKFAEHYGAIVLLKGAVTMVTDGQNIMLVERGCAGMATAGSGDVLDGILTAICGYNQNNLLAATATAAFINGLAGEIAQEKTNSVSALSGDTARCVASAITYILRG